MGINKSYVNLYRRGLDPLLTFHLNLFQVRIDQGEVSPQPGLGIHAGHSPLGTLHGDVEVLEVAFPELQFTLYNFVAEEVEDGP